MVCVQTDICSKLFCKSSVIHSTMGQSGAVDKVSRQGAAPHGATELSSCSKAITSAISQCSAPQIRSSVFMLICSPSPMLAIMLVVRPAASRKSSFLMPRSYRVFHSGWKPEFPAWLGLYSVAAACWLDKVSRGWTATFYVYSWRTISFNSSTGSTASITVILSSSCLPFDLL